MEEDDQRRDWIEANEERSTNVGEVGRLRDEETRARYDRERLGLRQLRSWMGKERERSGRVPEGGKRSAAAHPSTSSSTFLPSFFSRPSPKRRITHKIASNFLRVSRALSGMYLPVFL